MQLLTDVHSSSSWRSDDLFWSPWALGMSMIHICTYIHESKTFVSIFKRIKKNKRTVGRGQPGYAAVRNLTDVSSESSAQAALAQTDSSRANAAHPSVSCLSWKSHDIHKFLQSLTSQALSTNTLFMDTLPGAACCPVWQTPSLLQSSLPSPLN